MIVWAAPRVGKMNFISYSDCPISINGENFFATRADLAAGASISADRLMGNELDYYAPGGPLVSKVSLDYFVTGQNERVLSLTGKSPCSGSFGGINFSGAYLVDYEVKIAPYAPIIVTSSFVVYSGYDQTLEESSFYSNGISVANGAVVDLDNFNSSNLGFDNPISINYSINCERIPNYVIGREFPQDVCLGSVNKSMQVVGEGIGGLISYSGREIAEISITPNTINNISRGQTLSCSGVIRSQNLAVSKGGLVHGTIQIQENIR